MKKQNITKILLKNKRVNNYTKLLIVLQTWDYFGEHYIPNRKIMNYLNIHKKNVISLLNQLEEDNVIKIYYRGRKKYFKFIGFKEEKEKIINEENEIFSYDWLGDE